LETLVRPIPEGYSTVTQSLVVKGADKLVGFLKEAFDAREVGMFKTPNGTIAHAEVMIGDTRIMLGEEGPEMAAAPGRAYMYVRDADTSYREALAAGAISLREPADQFYGDRTAAVRDPVGNIWTLATHKEDVSQEEQMRRMAAQAKPQA
jgi:PhnB protein